jgi:hypothetical protein
MADQLVQGLPKETIEFFAVFSRFEYALKRCRFLRDKGYAEADWDKFSNGLGESFLQEVRECGKANTLLDKPPKKQIVGGGCSIEWKQMKPIADVRSLFRAIRRVRHNLFHGGKYPSGPEVDVSRDSTLLSEAIWVLRRALERCQNVNHAFSEPMN